MIIYIFLSSALKCHLSWNVHQLCCTIWWFTTSQLWLTVGCWLGCEQCLISCVPTACLPLGGVYDDSVRTLCVCVSADILCLQTWRAVCRHKMCLRWHQHATLGYDRWKLPTNPLFLWLRSVLKHVHTQHKAGVFQSLSPCVRVPHNRARKTVLLMLQRELSVWSGCGLAPKKSGNETWPR